MLRPRPQLKLLLVLVLAVAALALQTPSCLLVVLCRLGLYPAGCLVLAPFRHSGKNDLQRQGREPAPAEQLLRRHHVRRDPGPAADRPHQAGLLRHRGRHGLRRAYVAAALATLEASRPIKGHDPLRPRAHEAPWSISVSSQKPWLAPRSHLRPSACMLLLTAPPHIDGSSQLFRGMNI